MATTITILDTNDKQELQEQIDQLSSEKVDANNISLGIASDGLIYIFVA